MSWLGIEGDIKEFSSDTSSDNENEINNCKSLNDNLKSKFVELKEKRIRIKTKYEKKLKNKRLKSEAKNEVCLEATEKKAFSLNSKEVNTVINKNLNDQLVTAIKIKKYDLAEELSDKLHKNESQLKINNQVEALKFNFERKKLKKNIAWTFEAKKRWESKSNM
ncbi:unnamed protein product [Brachionus calyciflorus]|uniref:Uncharacterized protein n=1 Tax=Brachionus calyciflorus TaxID=104777 RepID=A0A813WF50_9BILA|nr:unnamed protein product [Brachionus calyciflorus]